MAIEIGSGISIGGGISFASEAGGGALITGTITVATDGSQWGYNSGTPLGSASISPAAGTTSFSSPGNYSSGGVIITQIGGNKLIVQQNNWLAYPSSLLTKTTGAVLTVVYFGSTSYELTLTSGFDYNAGQDWFEATYTSLTPTPGAPLDGNVTTISFPQPPILTAIAYNGAVTQFGLTGGTYGAVTVVAGTSINGSSTFTLTVGGIAQQVTMSIMGTFVAGDPYGLASKVGQTLSVSLVIP